MSSQKNKKKFKFNILKNFQKSKNREFTFNNKFYKHTFCKPQV